MKNLQRPSTDAEVEDGTLFFSVLKKNEIVKFLNLSSCVLAFVERGAVATAINTSFTTLAYSLYY